MTESIVSWISGRSSNRTGLVWGSRESLAVQKLSKILDPCCDQVTPINLFIHTPSETATMSKVVFGRPSAFSHFRLPPSSVGNVPHNMVEVCLIPNRHLFHRTTQDSSSTFSNLSVRSSLFGARSGLRRRRFLDFTCLPISRQVNFVLLITDNPVHRLLVYEPKTIRVADIAEGNDLPNIYEEIRRRNMGELKVLWRTPARLELHLARFACDWKRDLERSGGNW